MKTSSWFPVILGALFCFGVMVLAVSLFRLQVLNVAKFKEDQTLQITRRVRVPGLRGRILDRNGEVLAQCRPSWGIQCDLEFFQRRGHLNKTAQAVYDAIERLSRLLDLPCDITLNKISRHLATASAVPLTVWHDVSDHTLARFCEFSYDYPGFSDFTEAERIYPQGNLAAHVLGYTGYGEASESENDPVYYSAKELWGREGLEKYYNNYIRGVVGEKRILVNARGFSVMSNLDLEDARDREVKPVKGPDLKLTLDINLQLAVERELKGVTGAAVVIDPRNGEILAMASAPTFDPNACVPRLSTTVYAMLTNAPAKCGQNRAISESYAPGSTFKTITALAALKWGWTGDDEYECHGVYRLGKMRLHCWDRYGHGPITLREALEQSCNTFFCNLGTAIGTNALIEAARSFGLGSNTGVDLYGEVPGVVPDDFWKRRWYNEPWYPGDVCQMAIGQGMLLVTPLQMAVVAATLANGGNVYQPHFHQKSQAPKPVRRIPFSQKHIEYVRLGMKDVAEKGTGRRILFRQTEYNPKTMRRQRFRLNVDCAGKTGTAEIGRGETRRKNTWVIAFAPYQNPTLAVAMIIERGESGGSTVAPRVHAILAEAFGETEITHNPSGNSALEGRD